jgi:hypothetical protein
LRGPEAAARWGIALLEVKILGSPQDEQLRKHLPRNVFINQERELEVRRRLDTVIGYQLNFIFETFSAPFFPLCEFYIIKFVKINFKRLLKSTKFSRK